jgi:SAM-dependent methyltransferase
MTGDGENPLLQAVMTRLEALRARIGSLGARHLCPVCGDRVRGFQLLPESYVRNASQHGYPYSFDQAETLNYRDYSCPVCRASDRDRLYALYIQDYLAHVATDGSLQILDFAPSASFSRFMERTLGRSGLRASYRTADLSQGGVDDRVDITDMAIYGDNRFDLFICSHILEHVSDDGQALRELYRIVRPKGRGILMVPIILGLARIYEDPAVSGESERWRRFGQGDHVRLYSREGFMERVTEAGFSIHQYGQGYFGEKKFAQCGITKQSILYVVEK